MQSDVLASLVELATLVLKVLVFEKSWFRDVAHIWLGNRGLLVLGYITHPGQHVL
jgi:hypothetical protein